MQLRYSNDDVEVLLLLCELVYPLLGFGVVADDLKGFAGLLTGSLDHLLGRYGEKVGLSVDAAKLELGTVAGHEAALIVHRKDILVSELDVVVVELVDSLVGLLRVEAVAFGVEGVGEELAYDHVVGW